MGINVKRFKVFSLRPSKAAGTVWVGVGSATQNRDGTIEVFLDSLPIDGRLKLADVKEETPADKAEDAVVHLLRFGIPNCGFGEGAAPAQWPAGHQWLPDATYDPQDPPPHLCDTCKGKHVP